MRRMFLGIVTIVPFLLVGLATAADKDQPDPKKTEDVKKPASPVRADVDQLLKEYDKNGDGFLERDEAPPYLREHFDELDTNKDGKLSREELEKGAALLQPRRRPSDVVYFLIEMSDCDHGCTEELQRMYDVLRKLDKNHDGKIDAAELKDAQKQLIEERVDNILKELDTNKDGRISREEARGPIKQHFEQIDTNKDGFIDRAELLKAAEERIKQDKNKEK